MFSFTSGRLPGIISSLAGIALLSFTLPCHGQDRVDVYHHVPVTETRWMGATFNSIGVNFYPSASLYNPGTDATTDNKMYYFDIRMINFNPDEYKPVSIGLSLGYYMTRPEGTDPKFNGGDLNLCLFHISKDVYTNGFSVYGGVIAGAGIGTATYFHGEAVLGFVLPFDKTSMQAMSIDGGYNFSKITNKENGFYLEPGFFMRLAFCFGRGGGYVTTTSYN